MMRERPKVFGIGCPRTGTTTLHRCMEGLGYRHATWHADLFHAAIVEGDVERVLRAAEAFDSFDDLPWCALYRELDDRFPGSQFILTVRKDSPTWLRSRLAHGARLGHTLERDGSEPVVLQQARNSVRWPRDVHHYEQHNEEVRAYFANRPDALLEVCWETGDGWDRLCGYLGQPIPDQPFPHRNKTGGWNRFTAMWRHRWRRFAGPRT